jgi:hypothetical protein
MSRVRILEEAAEEAVEAAAWYESQRPGLGDDFGRALNAALDLLEADIVPLVAQTASHDNRIKRLILKRFPYEIVVTEFREEVVVIAVAHQSRRPGYWRDRELR